MSYINSAINVQFRISGCGYLASTTCDIYTAAQKVLSTAKSRREIRVYYNALDNVISLRANVEPEARYRLPERNFVGVYDGNCMIDDVIDDIAYVARESQC
jgi:hypothetical protein